MGEFDADANCLSGRGTNDSTRAWRSRNAIGNAVLALLVALVGALWLLAAWIFGPPPQPCNLPRLAVPDTPGQLAWSPDSSRLLAACSTGLYQIDLPNQSVRIIALPGMRLEFAWLDEQKRPLALVDRAIQGSEVAPGTIRASTTPFRQNPGLNLYNTYHLLRWEEGASRWEALEVSGNLVSINAGGRFVATLDVEDPAASASPSHVTITDLRRGKRLAGFSFSSPPALTWHDARTLLCFVDGARANDRLYRVGDPSPIPVPTGGLDPPRGQEAWAENHEVGVKEVLAFLRTWKVPAAPPDDPVDMVLTVGTPGETEVQEFALGRRVATVPFGPYRPQPQISPNGRYVAAVAGDGTLRLLDLKASAPRAGAQ